MPQSKSNNPEKHICPKCGSKQNSLMPVDPGWVCSNPNCDYSKWPNFLYDNEGDDGMIKVPPGGFSMPTYFTQPRGKPMPRTVKGIILRSGIRGDTHQLLTREAVIKAAKENNLEIRECPDGEVEAIRMISSWNSFVWISLRRGRCQFLLRSSTLRPAIRVLVLRLHSRLRR